MKKYIAEALGTFTLALVVALSLKGTFPIPTPILAGLTLALFVYTIGHLSGAHINPAVTIGAWSIQKINNQDAISYIIAQCIGGVLAMFVANTMNPEVIPSFPASEPIFVAELIGTFFFTFGIASVIYEKNPASVSGFVVGASLLLGITLAALLGSAGILNPAVALGLGSFNLAYIFGPIAGSILGMNVYKKLLNEKHKNQ